MKRPILNKLLLKHEKPVEKFGIPIPITAENLQKILPAVGLAARASAPVIGRALGAGAKAAKPQLAQAGKTALDTAAVTAGTDIGHAASKKFNQKTGLDKQSPDVASRMWKRGLVWDGNKHRWVKRPESTHEDIPAEGKSYHNNVIVIPKEKSFWGSGATYGETEKASKVLAAMLEHKFPGSTVIFGKNPIIEGEHKTEIDSWIDRNWKKAVSRRRGRKVAFDKSAVSDSIATSSRLNGKGHYSDKEIDQRKKDKKFWGEKNLEFLREHPEKRGGR